MPENNGSWKLPKLFRTLTDKSKRRISDSSIRKQLVSEKLWPSTLDHECYKAALILRSFCREGLLHDRTIDQGNRGSTNQPEPLRIPTDIIKRAKGLVVCSVLRAGLFEAGAGGSGVAVARLEDGSWSCPAAVEVQTAEIGVVVGVDIYDCVLVFNTQQALENLKNGRVFIGAEIYSVMGPLNVAWFLEHDDRARMAPIFTYLGSQRYYTTSALDNTTVITERVRENDEFYSPQKLTGSDILAGRVTSSPSSIRSFMECLKLAGGLLDVDENLIPRGPSPSEFRVVEEGHAFGIPDIEDPDPFGVMALEKQGMLVKDAETKRTASPESFEFNPSLTSPVHDRYHRRFGDTMSIGGRSSWRISSLPDRGDDRVSNRSFRTGRESPGIETQSITSSAPLSPGIARPTLTNDNESHSQQPPETLVTIVHQRRSFEKDIDSTDSLESKRLSNTSKSPTIYKDDNKLSVKQHNVELAPSASFLNQQTDAYGQSHLFDGNADLSPPLNNPLLYTGDQEPRRDKDVDQCESPKTDNETIGDMNSEGSDEFEDIDEDVEVFDGSQTQASAIAFSGATSMTASKAKVVDVAKLVPPVLPARNPIRLTTAMETLSGEAHDEHVTKNEMKSDPMNYERSARDSGTTSTGSMRDLENVSSRPQLAISPTAKDSFTTSPSSEAQLTSTQVAETSLTESNSTPSQSLITMRKELLRSDSTDD